ncbi:LON peptidase substrate-binding domain-containing protein [bacterium]|nr:LON peptidase substrate-binding domain-containing protein [bacterium]
MICPFGLMRLRIFEPRYLDMVKSCLRNKTSFCIVAVVPEKTAKPDGNFPFASIGTLMNISNADVTTVGLMMIDCIGQHRIKIHSFTQQADGLVIGNLSVISNDLEIPIPEDLKIVSHQLQRLIESFPNQGVLPDDVPIAKPYQYNDASWVSNRWVELLDLPLLEKQRLMQLDSPIVRLELIYDLLDLSYIQADKLH